jgi:hypothetical protein
MLLRYYTGRCLQFSSRTPLVFALHNRRWVSGILVGVDDQRVADRSHLPKPLDRKRSVAAASRLAEIKESTVPPNESTAPAQIDPLPFTRVRFHPPPICRWSVGGAAAIGAEFLGVTLDPPADGDTGRCAGPPNRIISGSNWRHLSRARLRMRGTLVSLSG